MHLCIIKNATLLVLNMNMRVKTSAQAISLYLIVMAFSVVFYSITTSASGGSGRSSCRHCDCSTECPCNKPTCKCDCKNTNNAVEQNCNCDCDCKLYEESFIQKKNNGSFEVASPRGSYHSHRDPQLNLIEDKTLKGAINFVIQLDKDYWNDPQLSPQSGIRFYNQEANKELRLVIHKPINTHQKKSNEIDATLYASGNKKAYLLRGLLTAGSEYKLSVRWSHIATEDSPVSNQVSIFVDQKEIPISSVSNLDFKFDRYDISISGADKNYRFDITNLDDHKVIP